MSMKPTYEQLEAQVLELSVKLANVESKCAELAAENAGLKSAILSIFPDGVEDEPGKMGFTATAKKAFNAAKETPATDTAIANIQAQGVEMLLASLPPYYTAKADIESFAAQLRQGVEHE